MDERGKIWEGIRAASLSVVPGAGHLYLGEKRGYWVLAFGLALILIWKTVWPPAQILYISIVIFSAFDAFAIAKRGYGLK